LARPLHNKKEKIMYCPSCGKEIPDKSAFCLLCGEPIKVASVTTKKTTEWVYIYYTRIWNKGIRYNLDLIPERLVRLDIWSKIQDVILPEIQTLCIDTGMEPVTEIGPSAFIFQQIGNQLNLVAFRVRFRRQKPDEFEPLKKRILGKWQVTEIKGRGINKALYGIAGMAGKLPEEITFSPDNTFVFGKSSGLYLIYDQSRFAISYDQVSDNSVLEIVYDVKWNGNNLLELHAQDNKVKFPDVYLRKA